MLGAVGASALAGCSSGSSSSSTTDSGTGSKPGVGTGSPVRGGSLTVGMTAEIDGFYPGTAHWDVNGYCYANAVYDPLMATGADGTVQPYLAQSMSPNATFDVWTMKLRPGVTFTDGSALTSGVVLANYKVLKASALTGVALDQVASVTTPDDMTVVYTLTGPNPTLPRSATWWARP
jgi:peptide/nickel transport system substrate-binding protein